MRKFSKILLASALISSLVVTPSFAAPSVNELKQNKKEAENKVKKLENELTSVMTKINGLEEDLVLKGQEVIDATEKLEKAEKKAEKQYQDMKHRIKIMYENGNSVMITKIFESGSVAEMLKQAEYVQAVHDSDRIQLEKYVKTKQKIADLKESLEKDMAKMQDMQKEFESEKENLNATIEDAKASVKDFDSKIQEAAREALRNTEKKRVPSGGSDYVPPSNGSGGQAIVSAAMSLVGVPYVWGGESASGVDCSGLVMLAHRAIGVSLSHSSGAQGSGGQAIPNMGAALPGDVVCYSGHVGIYVGGGKMVHAPDKGETVRVQEVYGSPWFRRYW